MTNRRIGIMGGSFNPPHLGHLAMAHEAKRRLDLTEVWFLVSPQNPLKSTAAMAPFADRVQMCRLLAAHVPWLHVSTLENRFHTTRTAQTLTRLKLALPDCELVWLMGSDNLATMHRWWRWRLLARQVGMAVFTRPGVPQQGLRSPAATTLRPYRRPATQRRLSAGTWCLLPNPAWQMSATAVRHSLSEGGQTPQLHPAVRDWIQLKNLYQNPIT